MQAVILAAGMGNRLGELTRNNTKCMIEVGGKKLIDRMLLQLSALGLSRVVIVTGYKEDNLRSHIGNRYDGKLRIVYVSNPVYERTNNIYSLALAAEYLAQDDTLLLESDLIFEDKALRLIMDNPCPNLALVAKYETWNDGTMVRIDQDNNIVSFVPKAAFRYSDVPFYYKTCNIYKFSREFSVKQYIPFLKAYMDVMGENEYYEQVLRVITALDKTSMKALPVSGLKWYEIDDIQDRDIAETLFAEGDEMLLGYASRYGGYWRFPHMTDFCYLVNPFFPTAGVRDEIKANFDALLESYPSGMRVNSLLGGKYFGIRPEYVCVGNGASEIIRNLVENHIDGRLGIIFPTFEEYPNRAEADRVVRFEPQGADFSYTAEDIMKFFTGRNLSALLLINPDNPSGNYIPRKDVITLAEWAAGEHIRMVLDESFVDFTDGSVSNSLLENGVLEKYPNLVVIKSISKSYGVPGLRLGVAASSDSALVSALRGEASIWNVNSFAEFYLQIFNKYKADYIQSCYRFARERRTFADELSRVPFLRVIPSQANYFLCEVTSRFTSRELTARLLEDYNILVKDCGTKSAFNGRNFIRIAIRSREDNARLASILLKM